MTALKYSEEDIDCGVVARKLSPDLIFCGGTLHHWKYGFYRVFNGLNEKQM